MTHEDSVSGLYGNCETEIFVHTGLGIQFRYPLGWQPQYSDGPLAILPPDARQLPGIQGARELGLSLTVGKNPDFRGHPPATLDAFCNASGANFQAHSVLSRRVFRLASGHDAIHWTFDFEKAGYRMRSHAVVAVRDDLLALLDISGLRSTLERVPHAWDAIVVSLQFATTPSSQRGDADNAKEERRHRAISLLLAQVLGDREAAERLVALEQRRNPNATELECIEAASRRIVEDNTGGRY